MLAFLNRLRARCGDFWWNTGLLFLAARAGDFINAFIGLWLVPKYVGMEELGAVLPLAGFASFLALPVSVFSTAFAKHVNVLAVREEWGKLKTMLRSVFLAVGVFLALACLAIRCMLPLVLERVRVAQGTLGLVIVASALLGTVAPIYMNTLYVMKRFKTVSLINLVGAPVRLAVMLAAMPFRALTGYFVGQAAAPSFQIAASVFSLRHLLGPSVKAEPYWTKPVVRDFCRYMLFVCAAMFAGGIVLFVEPLVIRQRLPEMDSAGYYMISRFAEIGTYLGLTLSTVVFPYVSEAKEAGGTGNRLIVRSMLGSIAFGSLCAVGFGFFGRWAFSFLPNGSEYARYVPELIALTLILSIGVALMCFTTGETAANRFRWFWWFLPANVIYVAALLVLTGHGYLQGLVPDSVLAWIVSFDACRLRFILGVMAAVNVLKLVCAGVQLGMRK